MMKRYPSPNHYIVEYLIRVLNSNSFRVGQARLDDLVDTIFKTFKDRFVEGEEVGLKKDDGPL